jgi:hypothetical protein
VSELHSLLTTVVGSLLIIAKSMIF